MGLITEGERVTITCDKCKDVSVASAENYNDVFWKEGWALNKGRKYMHLCNSCLPAKSRKAMKKYKELFGHSH